MLVLAGCPALGLLRWDYRFKLQPVLQLLLSEAPPLAALVPSVDCWRPHELHLAARPPATVGGRSHQRRAQLQLQQLTAVVLRTLPWLRCGLLPRVALVLVSVLAQMLQRRSRRSPVLLQLTTRKRCSDGHSVSQLSSLVRRSSWQQCLLLHHLPSAIVAWAWASAAA